MRSWEKICRVIRADAMLKGYDSQAEIARKIGITPQSLSNFLMGRSHSKATAKKLEDLLGKKYFTRGQLTDD